MPLNFVRGFRRIGWVLVFPIAALIVLAFYESMKVFSPAAYEVAHTVDYDVAVKNLGGTSESPPRTLPANFFSILEAQKQLPPGTYSIELPGLGNAYFSGEIPKDVMGNILKDFTAKPHSNDVKPWELDWFGGLPPPGFVLDKSVPLCWRFTVHKQVSKSRLAGLIIGAFACVALVVQGSISILAWVFRGFKG